MWKMLRVLGAWLRAGEGIGWLAAGTMPNSLYRMPLVYLFLACVLYYSCSFLFVVFVCLCFLLLSLELGRCSSDLFLSSRPSFFFLRGSQGAANGQDSWNFFKNAQVSGRLDACLRAGFISPRLPPPWTSVFHFFLFLYDVWP